VFYILQKMNLEREIKDVEVGCFSFVFQQLILDIYFLLFFCLNYLWIGGALGGALNGMKHQRIE